jgi:preprotein translocase subunit YajC
MLAVLLWAVDEAANGGGGNGAPQMPNPLLNPLTIMLGLFLLFWLLVIRPSMRRQETERQSMFTTLEKNDQILTIGGIYATVVSTSEKEDEMVVRLEDNVRMKMTRSSVSRNFTKEQRAKDAQQPTANKEPSK